MNDLEFTPSPARVRDLKKVGEGRQAELFVWAEGVVKLSRSSRDRSSAQLEAMAMYSLQATGIPLPRIFGTVTIEQRPGIVMERLAGTDQFSLLERKPWLFWTAAKKLAQLHAQIHSMVAPEQLQSLKPSIRREIESSDSMPYESKHLALASLDHLPDGAAVCHWDFHPGNVIETTDGSKVVDWSNLRRGAALADVARTLLIIRAGALPPGTPFLARKLIGFGRSVLGWRYLHEYRRLRPFHDRDLQPWSLVSVASRLSYGIAEERGHLLELLQKFSALQVNRYGIRTSL
jgi:aminoglycoside phosphotransferase (APT) family kinase protein